MLNNIQVIKNHIVFKFADNVDHDGKFINSNELLHIISGDFDDSAHKSRLGIVVKVGPNADTTLIPGTKILIESLKWTMGFELNKETYWRTDDSCVLATVS